MAGQMASASAAQVAPQQTAGMTPPPLSPQRQVFVALNGQQAGPFDLPTLQQMVRYGQLTLDTLAWQQGMPAWATAGSMAALAPLFN
jgi:hypothetical protein